MSGSDERTIETQVWLQPGAFLHHTPRAVGDRERSRYAILCIRRRDVPVIFN